MIYGLYVATKLELKTCFLEERWCHLRIKQWLLWVDFDKPLGSVQAAIPLDFRSEPDDLVDTIHVG